MEVTLVSSNRYEATLQMRNISLTVANVLRRVIRSHVPSIAPRYHEMENIDSNDVHVIKNVGTSLNNEFIASRIALIPIHLNMNEVMSYVPEMHVYVVHVKNTTDEAMYVTSKDIKVFDAFGTYVGDDRRNVIFPSDQYTGDHCVICRLVPGGEIHISYKARRGVGLEHARWSPVSMCRYTYDDDQNDDDDDDMGDKPGRVITFFIESECGMTPLEIMTYAIDTLRASIQEVPDLAIFSKEDAPSEESESKVRKEEDEAFEWWQVTLKDRPDIANRTIAQLLQSMIYKLHGANFDFKRGGDTATIEDDGNGSRQLVFASYELPHPTDIRVIIRMLFMSKKNTEDDIHVRHVIASVCESSVAMLNELKSQIANMQVKI